MGQGKWAEPGGRLSGVLSGGLPEEDIWGEDKRVLGVSLRKGRDEGFWAEVRGPGVQAVSRPRVCVPRRMPGVGWDEGAVPSQILGYGEVLVLLGFQVHTLGPTDAGRALRVQTLVVTHPAKWMSPQMSRM